MAQDATETPRPVKPMIALVPCKLIWCHTLPIVVYRPINIKVSHDTRFLDQSYLPAPRPQALRYNIVLKDPRLVTACFMKNTCQKGFGSPNRSQFRAWRVRHEYLSMLLYSLPILKPNNSLNSAQVRADFHLGKSEGGNLEERSNRESDFERKHG